MGATGCGKSKLSIDLATRFFPSSEIINSDKIQVYNGLNITTNKISMLERRGVPHHLLDKRVDEMLDSEMLEELENYFEKEGFSDSGSVSRVSGIRKAIGVPEFERYFKGEGSYDDVVKEIKENTRVLAEMQVWKIMRLREAGWDLQRVDATRTFTAVMTSDSGKNTAAKELWKKHVLEPSAKIVKNFLSE
ncbi:hypothetical protein K7X08_001190 [Anisodus acutangulus]|uniref:Adenylate isopentenyltransferase n=1 Tax=Anisodus acutangulus TaxID=402998 RepID=A0A9Q1MRU6_9SOLA|nr:hypothetical protein K7X08_001190 [Anisodus acutangulus]